MPRFKVWEGTAMKLSNITDVDLTAEAWEAFIKTPPERSGVFQLCRSRCESVSFIFPFRSVFFRESGLRAPGALCQPVVAPLRNGIQRYSHQNDTLLGRDASGEEIQEWLWEGALTKTCLRRNWFLKSAQRMDVSHTHTPMPGENWWI